MAGIEVADIGCGYGHATNIMAEAYPESRFVGWDTSEAATSAGRAEARRKQLGNVCFERRDALMLAGAEQFDFVMSLGTVHHQARPELFLRRVAAALRPGATFLFTELWASRPSLTTWPFHGRRQCTRRPASTACRFRWPRAVRGRRCGENRKSAGSFPRPGSPR